MPLERLTQEDFSAGFFTAVARQLIPEEGVYDLQNFLLDDDGSLYRRGGSVFKAAAFGSSLRLVWDGYMLAGQRTLIASSTGWGVLGADDMTPVALGGGGLTVPTRVVHVGGLLFIGGGLIYGGSRQAADYSTGTLSVTNGSTTVGGTGTAFAANVDPGMLLQIGGGTRYYLVTAVNSDTSLTIKDPYEGATNAAAGYTLTRLGTANSPYRNSGQYVALANRLVSLEGNRIYFSAGRDPLGQVRPHLFNANDFHELPAGTTILGGVGVRDTLLVFATNGLWQISNMALNIVDQRGALQHRVEHVTQEIVLWGAQGIAAWDNAFVVPCIDGVYRVDGQGPPEPLSRSIRPLISKYVRAGYVCGQAVVHRNHYFLPVLDSSGGVLQDMLVCRLDRPTSTRLGQTWPWTRLTGQAAKVSSLAVRVPAGSGRIPLLLAGSLAGRVLDCSSFFEPSAAFKNDADGSTHLALLETRDFPTGKITLNTVRRLRVRYELVDAATDVPKISAYYSTGSLPPTYPVWNTPNWNSFQWADSTSLDIVPASGQAPPDDGRKPFTWLMTKRVRYIRARLTCADPAAKLAIRSLEFYLRQSARDR